MRNHKHVTQILCYPIFPTPLNKTGTQLVGYNRMKFLLESLEDLDEQFKKFGGPGLLFFRGDSVQIFRRLWHELGINKICFEEDCEPIWNERDERVEALCNELGIELVKKISHTLWHPKDVIRANGGASIISV
jgi:cryptochrome